MRLGHLALLSITRRANISGVYFRLIAHVEPALETSGLFPGSLGNPSHLDSV